MGRKTITHEDKIRIIKDYNQYGNKVACEMNQVSAMTITRLKRNPDYMSLFVTSEILRKPEKSVKKTVTIGNTSPTFLSNGEFLGKHMSTAKLRVIHELIFNKIVSLNRDKYIAEITAYFQLLNEPVVVE